MTEGIAAPVALYGACVKTHEIIDISGVAAASEPEVDGGVGVDESGPIRGRERSGVSGREGSLVGTDAGDRAAAAVNPKQRGGRRRAATAGVCVVPRCYCILSRAPHFELLFTTLYGLLRQERSEQPLGDQVVLDVEVPRPLAEAHHSGWAEVVHAEGVYSVLLPAALKPGQHFQLTVPSCWRSRKFSGAVSEQFEPSESWLESLDRARVLQPGAIGSDFAIPASTFGGSTSGGFAFGPGKIPNTHTSFALWTLGNALEQCTVEVLLTAATSLLLERPLIVLHPKKSARSAVAFALLALLGPWRYPHTALPLVPPAMYELATAPVPFLLGMPSVRTRAIPTAA